ncbi:predicted protein [Sclerotinia sclerotiorum 1980 UF-70]|uniref:Uncharacterized protein n=1 Tax=Sclerotinia sclerotiorum (strain ATCC 18683 / 1980 / Ss-1) TaxID=665079 RepID=A7EHL9_SCLS1|nr:predicted protein [Sclerotinia sclerotiorum 1980 UF-70]EDO02335.1 predicted protein [Sclerotinia sclerotiorum 1980 UF-70]
MYKMMMRDVAPKNSVAKTSYANSYMWELGTRRECGIGRRWERRTRLDEFILWCRRRMLRELEDVLYNLPLIMSFSRLPLDLLYPL